MTNPYALSSRTNGRSTFCFIQNRPQVLRRLRFSPTPLGFIHLLDATIYTWKLSARVTLIRHSANYLQMRHFENDTTAAIATAISGSSAVIHFAQTWQPVVSLVVGLVGIVSGLFAIRYYSKKINGK